MKIILARSLAKMAAPVSINCFHFALENSAQKGDPASNEKNANTRRVKDTICVLPAQYGRSLSDWLPPYVCDWMCVFLNNSDEEKINSFTVVVSWLNFLIEEQISSMNVFKGTENVAIVEVWSAAANFISHQNLQN